jgi:cell division protein FtsL
MTANTRRPDGALASEARDPVEHEPDDAAPRCSAARFYGYWLFALAATVAAFASHIYVRQQVVSLGYDLGRERAIRAQLENQRREMELELASLASPSDLSRIARDELGLDAPADDQLVETAVAAGGDEGEGAWAPVPVAPDPAEGGERPAARFGDESAALAGAPPGGEG